MFKVYKLHKNANKSLWEWSVIFRDVDKIILCNSIKASYTLLLGTSGEDILYLLFLGISR